MFDSKFFERVVFWFVVFLICCVAAVVGDGVYALTRCVVMWDCS